MGSDRRDDFDFPLPRELIARHPTPTGNDISKWHKPGHLYLVDTKSKCRAKVKTQHLDLPFCMLQCGT